MPSKSSPSLPSSPPARPCSWCSPAPPTITISRQSTFLTTDRSRSWTPCRRDCKAAPPSSKIPIHPEPSLGPPGPSLASAAGPATKVNDPPDQSQCETGSNASMPSSKDTSSMKMCAHASPLWGGGRRYGARCVLQLLPPPPTPPHNGEGSRAVLPLEEAAHLAMDRRVKPGD